MAQDENTPLPAVVHRPTFDEQLEVLRAREKAHIREGDAIAAGAREQCHYRSRFLVCDHR
jgi:hypothetical protein